MHYKLVDCLVICGLLLVSGCQPGTLKPDERHTSNVGELRRQAYQAYSEGNWVEAQKAYVALTRQVPQEAEPWFRLGNIHARLKRPADAVAAYHEALVRDPDHGKAWHNMGIVQLRQAMNSFLNLEAVTEPKDPLNSRASIMLDAVGRVLENEFDAGADEPIR